MIIYLVQMLVLVQLLGTRLLPSDDFDVLLLMRHKKRRTEWKRVVRQTEPPSVAGAISSSSRVRMRVASSDWCASRHVVSVSSSPSCARTRLANPSGPLHSSTCFQPSGKGLCTRQSLDQFDGVLRPTS